MLREYAMFGFAVGATALFAQQNPSASVELGRLSKGATVSFPRSPSGEWGIRISGAPADFLAQPKPAQIQVFRGGDNVAELASGYQSVTKEANALYQRLAKGD